MQASRTAQRVVRFSIFEADLDSAELRKNGVRVRIQDQPFQILRLLITRPGQIVSRETIQQTLWPSGTFVDFEHGVNTAVKKLRETLEDEAESPRFIETVPKRGYRFIGQLAEEKPIVRPTPQQSIADPPPHWPNKKTLIRLSVTTFAVVVIVAVVWVFKPDPDHAGPSVVHSQQLTYSGRVACNHQLQTDGTRLFYIDAFGLLRATGIGGGPEQYVETDLKDVGLLNISPDRSTLMVQTFGEIRPGIGAPIWLLPVNGGARQRLGDVVAQDAAWSPDGKTIVYSQGSSLFLCDSHGNNAKKLAELNGEVFWIRWSPDGRFFRFVVSNAKTGRGTVWQADTAGSVKQLLLTSDNEANPCCGVWSPDGKSYLYLSFVGDETQVWALPGDRRVSGNTKPLPVAIGGIGSSIQAIASSPTRNKLFMVGLNAIAEVYKAQPAFKSATRFLPDVRILRLSYSVDGNWITYYPPEHSSLWRIRSDGTEQLQLTSPPLNPITMAFSRDASKIAIMAKLPDQPFKVYWLNSDGGALHELPTTVVNQADPSWTLDGTSIIFGEPPFHWAESGNKKAIYISNLTTGETTKIKNSEGWFSPRLSPDGRYLSALSVNYKRLGIYTFASDTWRDLPQPKRAAGESWSPDGQWIYYNDGNTGVRRVSVKDGHDEFVLDTKQLIPELVCHMDGFDPKGEMIFPCTRRNADIYSVDWQ